MDTVLYDRGYTDRSNDIDPRYDDNDYLTGWFAKDEKISAEMKKKRVI